MSDTLGVKRPCSRREGILAREVLGDLVLYDESTHEAHSLNRTAAAVWRLADGTRTLEQVSRDALGDLPPELRPDALTIALRDLEKAGLLEIPDEIPSTTVPHVSRRDVLRRTGHGAVVAALLPAVVSLLAPTAAEAASLLPSGASCTSSSQCASGLCVGGKCA